MTPFSDLLCECAACTIYRKNLTAEQLAIDISESEWDTYLVEFESKIVRYRDRFQTPLEKIPPSILQVIFDKPFK